MGKPTAAEGSNAPFGIPVLRQRSIKEAFDEMTAWMRANRGASQTQLADLFEGMAGQISSAHPNWQARRSTLLDGTIAFVGRDIRNVFAVDRNGRMFQSDVARPPLRFNQQTGQFELDYSVMWRME